MGSEVSSLLSHQPEVLWWAGVRVTAALCRQPKPPRAAIEDGGDSIVWQPNSAGQSDDCVVALGS